MDKDNLKFNEQEAPEKNTDAAFVKVGADGKPAMPDATQPDNETANTKTPKEGTLADR